MTDFPANARKRVPATPQQEGVWFHAVSHSTAYWNFTQRRTFTGVLHAEALKKALDATVGRHASLRTHFELDDDTLYQVIDEAVAVDAIFEHLTRVPADEAALAEWVRAESAQSEKYPFDFGRDLLIRLKVLTCGPTHVLVLTMSHIITDATSMQLFWGDLVRHYNAFVAGVAAVPPPARQYDDYATGLAAFSQTPAYRRQQEYWRERLPAGLPPLHFSFNTGAARPPIHHRTTDLPARLVEDIRTFSLRKKVLYSAVFQAAYFILLHRYSRHPRIAIGNTVHGRGFGKNSYKEVIGLFAKRLVNVQELAADDTVGDLLGRVNADLVASFANSDVAYEELLREHNERNKTGMTPLFTAIFNLIKEGGAGPVPAGLEEQPGRYDQNEQVGDVDAEIGLSVFEGPHGTRLRLDLKCDETFRPVADRMLESYVQLLAACLSDPQARVGALGAVPEAERQVLAGLSVNPTPYPSRLTLVDLFARQLHQRPHQPALVSPHQPPLSYQQLEARSNQLAHLLLARGLQAEQAVGLCLERGNELIVSLLAVLKAGGAYLPLDPSYPTARLGHMLEKAAWPLVVTCPDSRGSLPPDYPGPVLCLQAHQPLISRQPTLPPQSCCGLSSWPTCSSLPARRVSPRAYSSNTVTWSTRCWPRWNSGRLPRPTRFCNLPRRPSTLPFRKSLRPWRPAPPWCWPNGSKSRTGKPLWPCWPTTASLWRPCRRLSWEPFPRPTLVRCGCWLRRAKRPTCGKPPGWAPANCASTRTDQPNAPYAQPCTG